jgi:drug/metabolite transporter (DMT)-like permease
MVKDNKVIKAVLLGLLANFFLSAGLIVNSLMASNGSHWAWTASLRYLLLLIIVVARKQAKPLARIFRSHGNMFIIWGNVSFGIFYGFLTYASLFGPGWLVAAGFETTILAGLLLSPIIYKDHRAKIPANAFILSSVLVVCIAIMQIDRIRFISDGRGVGLSLIFSLIAAFLWPLGNRKLMLTMEFKNIQLNSLQRVLGMTVGSLPSLIVLAMFGFLESGLPGKYQLITSLFAALLSGVLGSVLFYRAIQLVKNNPVALATVEATQVTTIFFTLLAEVLFKGMEWPGSVGLLGCVLMIACLTCYSFYSIKKTNHNNKE